MKKLLITAGLGLGLVLTGCGAEEVEKKDDTAPKEEVVKETDDIQLTEKTDDVELTDSATMEDSGFKLTLTSEKTVYKTDEPIQINSVFSYLGEEEVNLEHGAKIVSYSISDQSGKIQLFDIMTMQLMFSTMKNGDTLDFPLEQRGVINEDGTTVEGTEMKEGLFLPEGTYTINAVANVTVANGEDRTPVVVGPILHIKVEK